MKFPVKQKILCAIYTELHSELPDMGRITPASLCIDPVQFRVAVDKLNSESLIKGAVIVSEGQWPIPRMVCLEHVSLTEQGTHYAAENLREAM
ncbi:MAG: hypothetical protein SCM57_01350 [Bacillota bacterium]|nr:hypothetical protein [Bacillota bacterium]